MRRFDSLLFSILIFTIFSGFAQTPKWTSHIPVSTTFSSPRTVDLNKDGIEDIVMGGGLDGRAEDHGVVALDGKTGDLLWNFSTNDEIFGSAQFIDLTGDTIKDIIIGGRYAELYALNGSTGELIWEFFEPASTEALDSGWFNFYTPQFVPDQTGDGIQDLLFANGGNHSLESWITDREPGYLMIINSVNGEIISKATTPDDKETYCSPIIHDFDGNGSLEIIYGTGGEYVEGSLWKVSLAELLTGDITKSTLLATEDRGFIAPPATADMNNDGKLDIIAQAFNGTVYVINGVSNEVIWKNENKGKESSAAPVIGNFTGDFTPDVYVVLAKGEAPSYEDYFQMMIDGKTGKTMMMDSLGSLHFGAGLAIDLNSDGRDEAVSSINNHDGKNFKHSLIAFDFQNNEVLQLSDEQDGVNLGSTPQIKDIDNNSFLDIIYAYRADSINPMGAKGFRVNRIETDYNTPVSGIASGAYMGTDFDGKYHFTATLCSSDITASVVATDESCTYLGDGKATVTLSGTDAESNIVWGNGFIGNTQTNLKAGTYPIRVTTADNCFIETQVIIKSPYTISFGGIIHNANCAEDATAEASVGSTGCPCMTSGCIFEWDNGGSAKKATNLTGGWHTVTIKHTDGCNVTDSVLILPEPITATFSVTNDQNEMCDGSVIAKAHGGTPDYIYQWTSPTITNPVIEDLCTGTYVLEITDAHNCTGTSSVKVNNGDTINALIETTIDDLSEKIFYNGSELDFHLVNEDYDHIEIYSISGKIVFSKAYQGNLLSIEDIRSGEYICILSNKGEQIGHYRFVK